MPPTKKNVDIYADCPQNRTKPNTEIDAELTKEISRNFRTLPSFEKTVFDYVNRKHYSLVTNEMLHCRWVQYKKHIEDRVFAPFEFPSNRDLHFHNGMIRFMPALSVYRHPSYRMKLRQGPGVDIRGQMPIPQELLMKRGRIEKEEKLQKRRKETREQNTKKHY